MAYYAIIVRQTRRS